MSDTALIENENENENETPTIAALLERFGMSESGTSIPQWLRDVYGAVKDGTTVYMFTHDADDSLLALFASSSDVENGSAIVTQNADATLDAKQIASKVNYRSNTNERDKMPKVLLGAASATVLKGAADSQCVRVSPVR